MSSQFLLLGIGLPACAVAGEIIARRILNSEKSENKTMKFDVGNPSF
jgi:hypothetical protein